MPGMMRSRKSGCMCIDCDGPQIADRASEKRSWQHWRDEYEATVDEALTDWCPHDLRACPFDVSFCCTAFREES